MNGAEKIKQLKGPIFIFGAGGFIGSNLLYKISSQRDDVYGIIRNKTNSWRLNALNINREKILIADVLSKEELKLIFDRYSPKTIFNLSAYGSSSYQRDYNLIYNVNLIGTANIMDTSNKESIFINAGSSSEYGYNSSNSSESNQLQPNSHYSVSKIASSYLTSFYAKMHNRLALNLRLFSIYGQFEDAILETE